MTDMNLFDMDDTAKPILVDKSILAGLAPISKLSENRLNELADVCVLEQISQSLDPTRMREEGLQSLYLLKGDLGIRYENGKKLILRAGTPAARHPIDSELLKIKDTIALTPIEIVRIDLDLLDIMLTWDQISGEVPARVDGAAKMAAQHAKLDEASFYAFKLKNGVFSKLPAANIETMLSRLTKIDVKAEQVIIKQGQEGDYYYLIQHGTAIVSRVKDPRMAPEILAEITIGAAFGEEALASNNKRNATVKMKTDGQLLRLSKDDFIALLKAPIVNTVSMEEAKRRVADGAVWLDVRFASEFNYHHIADAINAPIHELREKIDWLDKTKQYIVYCQTGRRSSAAAFILAQYDIDAVVLEGGTRSA